MLLTALQAAGHAVLRAQGFRERLILSNGRRVLAYDRAGRGDGPPMLLVHGLGGSATSWIALARKLLPLTRRVRLLDLPGHGRATLAVGEAPVVGTELLQAVGAALSELGEPS
ncbi:MAG: alpha/beta fold hydrolase, partial [Deltaproteobacteria bacterium]|nr:alpha/beta fold hydrolase [Deltaproteobacteria bacterium]